MPDNPEPIIIERLMEIGPVEADSMGTKPITWGSITEYAVRMGIDIPPWQSKLLRRLSTEYLAQTRAAEERHCPAPWHKPVSQEEREADERMLRLALG